jgi:hypothetical protein
VDELARRLDVSGRLPANGTVALLGIRIQPQPVTVDAQLARHAELPAGHEQPAAEPGQVTLARSTAEQPGATRGERSPVGPRQRGGAGGRGDVVVAGPHHSGLTFVNEY